MEVLCKGILYSKSEDLHSGLLPPRPAPAIAAAPACASRLLPQPVESGRQAPECSSRWTLARSPGITTRRLRLSPGVTQERWSHLGVWRSWRMMCSSRRTESWGPNPGARSLPICLPRAYLTAPSADFSSSLSPTAVALAFDPPARKTRLPRPLAQPPPAKVSCCLVG